MDTCVGKQTKYRESSLTIIHELSLSSPTIITVMSSHCLHRQLYSTIKGIVTWRYVTLIIFTLSSLTIIVLKTIILFHEEYISLEDKPLQEFSRVKNQVEILWCNFLVGGKLFNHWHNLAHCVIFIVSTHLWLELSTSKKKFFHQFPLGQTAQQNLWVQLNNSFTTLPFFFDVEDQTQLQPYIILRTLIPVSDQKLWYQLLKQKNKQIIEKKEEHNHNTRT